MLATYPTPLSSIPARTRRPEPTIRERIASARASGATTRLAIAHRTSLPVQAVRHFLAYEG